MRVSNPSDFKEKHRKKLFELPSGLIVELYKIDPLKMIAALGFVTKEEISEIGNLSENQRETAIGRLAASLSDLEANKKKQLETLDYIVMNGVSRPTVTNKPLQDVTDDEIHITDFGEDLDALIKAIIEFSGSNNLSEIAKEA